MNLDDLFLMMIDCQRCHVPDIIRGEGMGGGGVYFDLRQSLHNNGDKRKPVVGNMPTLIEFLQLFNIYVVHSCIDITAQHCSGL